MPDHSHDEGVIHFSLDHIDAPAPVDNRIAELQHWHSRLYQAGLVGQDPGRYGGLAYGNISIRSDDHGFIISASQVSGHRELAPDDFVEVMACNIQANHVCSRGRLHPSSESMTHAAVYQADNSIMAVLHVHAPALWQACARLHLPCTDRAITYGTPEMANAVTAIIQSSCHPQQGLLCMAGHQDGVIAWGESIEQAGRLLLKTMGMVEH